MEQRLHILVVDDDEDDFELTRDLLQDAYGSQAEAEWAKSYDEGLSALTHNTFDVCLLDYRLGMKTGLDLLIECRSRGIQPPTILLTGQGEREVDMQAMEAGAADFLTKDSLRADALERSIRHSLERHRDRMALKRLNEMLESRVEQRTRELEQANQSLQLADRRKDEFLAILAHELRNPLAPISNSLELINRRPDDRELCRESRETMRRQLDQLVRLTDDLLEVSRISRGKISLRIEPIPLSEVVSRAVEAAQPWIDSRQQALRVRLPNEEVHLNADAHRLAQVISNLLNNASKFSPAGGRIDLNVSRAGEQAVISVGDEGIGLEAKQLSRVFEMFEQVETSLGRAETGLGIGLTLVRELTQMHGGNVEVRSEGLGHGSEFIVRLPLQPAERPPETAEPDRSGERSHRGYRILVVDDNRDSAMSMAKLLELSGYSVAKVFTGRDALQQVETEPPRVVLLDIGLPDLNGYEVARELRQRYDGKLSLIALTGWGQDADRRRAEEAGFDLHLLKPVDYSQLLEVLQSFG